MNRSFRHTLFAIILLTAALPVLGQSVNVPMNHWVYDFLDRCETMHLFRELHGRTLPMTRGEIAEILKEIDQTLRSDGRQITPALANQLNQFLGEFHEELEPLGHSNEHHEKERHLLTWTEGDNIIHADADIVQELKLRSGDSYESTKLTSHTSLGGILRGRLKKSFSFYVFARNTLHKGTDITRTNYDPSQGRPIGIAGNNVYTDEATAYLVWNLPWFELQFGRDQMKWGPGYHGSLMLSAKNPLFDMIKLKASFNRFRFISVHGFLNSSIGKKYMAAHRLEVRVAPWLFIAGSESVIYGNRGIEIQYMNPIMPYHVAEHHMGDRDNNTMSFDFTAYPLKNVKTYFELFLDDYNLSKNAFKHYGNKFAFLLGGFWVHPFSIRNADIRLEYTRVEPYVYTHHDSINVYTNYDQSIGHWLGPNADDWFFELNFLPHRDIKLSLTYEHIRRGEGSLFDPHDVTDGTEKHFLKGIIEKQHHIGCRFVGQVLRDLFISLGGYRIITTNQDRTAGNDVNNTHISLDMWFNY